MATKTRLLMISDLSISSPQALEEKAFEMVEQFRAARGIVNMIDQFIHSRNKEFNILIDSAHLRVEPHEESDQGDQSASAPKNPNRKIGDGRPFHS